MSIVPVATCTNFGSDPRFQASARDSKSKGIAKEVQASTTEVNMVAMQGVFD